MGWQWISEVSNGSSKDGRTGVLRVTGVVLTSRADDVARFEKIVLFDLVLGVDVARILSVPKDFKEQKQAIGVDQKLTDIVEGQNVVDLEVLELKK